MYNHQTCITMKVEIENTFYAWDEGMTDKYVGLVNVLVSASNEQELRQVMKELSAQNGFDKYFKYGFGHHHLWVSEIVPNDNMTDGNEARFLIVRF